MRNTVRPPRPRAGPKNRSRVARFLIVLAAIGAARPPAPLDGQTPPRLNTQGQTQSSIACATAFSSMASALLLGPASAMYLYGLVHVGPRVFVSLVRGHVQANPQLWNRCLGSPNPSTRGSALALCEYNLTAPGISRTGTGAMFLDFGSTKLITFPEGQITYTGSGPGSYPVGASRGPGDNQGATLTIDDGAGGILPLSSADGGSSSYLDRPVDYPPAATLTVVHVDANEIEGRLDGTFFVGGLAPGGPAMFTHVPATVAFRAAAATGPRSCTPM